MNNINGTVGNTAFQLQPILNPGEFTLKDFVKEAPMPLIRQQAPREEFPIRALGNILGPAAQRCHEVVRAPLSMCASSFLAAANLVVQPHVDIDLGFGKPMPVSELFLTLGASGARKSKVDDAALNPINIEESSRLIDYENAKDKFDKDKEVFEIAKSDALSGKKTRDKDEKLAALSALGDAPLPPRQTDILLPDPNSEGLYFYLKDHQPSVGLFTDEAGTFLGGHAMDKDNLLKTCAFLSKLWDGKKAGRNRKGDGSSSIFGKRFAMHLMAQMNVGMSFLSNPIAQDQGMPSRMLVTAVEVDYGNRPLSDVNILQTDEVKQYTEHTLFLLKRELPLVGKNKDRLSPRPVQLSPDAYQLFTRFYNSVESEMRDGGAYSTIRAFASKAPEHAGRIALTLEAFANIDTPHVSATAMADGIEIVQFFLSEAVRLTDSGSVDSKTEQANELRVWLKNRKKESVTLADVYQRGPKKIRKKETARSLMMYLQSHGWAAPLDGGAMDDSGNQRREAWDVSACL